MSDIIITLGIGPPSATPTPPGTESKFTSDPTLVLPSGYTFGKYINGDTPAWTGITAVQAILDAIIDYINPAFSAFSVSGQSATVEVGTTLSGSKTFTWTITLGSGTVATIDIYDNTAGAALISNTPNDGSQSVSIATLQLNTNGSTQSWKGILHDTGVVQNIDSSNFVVTSRFLLFYAPVAASLTNSASVRALSNSAFYTGTTSFNLDTGTTQTKFVLGLPPTVTITSVIDLDAFNAEVTSLYVAQSNINVLDAGSTNRSYNIYEANVGVPYSTSHRHRVTIS